jgi:prepilin peptidase CpaA
MSTAQLTVWIATLVLTLLAGSLDWRARRIPNWLTVPGFFVGIALHVVLSGWRGALFALEGAGLALLILLVPVLMRLLGAGDWKLMGAVGAFVGPAMLLFVMLASVLVSGVMAVAHMIAKGHVKTTFRKMIVLVRGVLAFGLKVNPQASLDTPDSLKLPYGVAVAAGTVMCFCAALWLR